MMSSWNLCAVDTSKEFCRTQVIPAKHNELFQKDVLHFICVIVFPNMGIVGMKKKHGQGNTANKQQFTSCQETAYQTARIKNYILA